MAIPKLYKYRRFNENKVLSFTGSGHIFRWQNELFDGMILLSSPVSFNDPYDCDLVVEDSFLKEQVARELYIESAETYKPLTEQEKELLRTSDNWKNALETVMNVPLSDDLNEKLMGVVNKTLQEVRENVRVSCFSSTKDSILMWSHYAENHSGFCIEYDFNSCPLELHLHPVQYSKIRKQISGSFANSNNTANRAIYEAMLYKSDVWNYENEWRCIFYKNELNPFPFDVNKYFLDLHGYMKAIYLGAKTSDEHISAVCEHYNGTKIKIYQMKMKIDSYELKPVLLQG